MDSPNAQERATTPKAQDGVSCVGPFGAPRTPPAASYAHLSAFVASLRRSHSRLNFPVGTCDGWHNRLGGRYAALPIQL